jgi:hypothetical protein
MSPIAHTPQARRVAGPWRSLLGALAPALLGGAATLATAPAAAQAPASGPSGIYTCVDDKGRRLTSDRPIAECTAKEQRVLNKDGSLKAIHPPTMTADERAEHEAREKRAAEARAAQADAVRRDRNLMARYPNEAPHQKAREAALGGVRLALRSSEQRLAELAAERKPLLDEAEFYKGRTMPDKLKAQIEAVDASVEAQRNAVATQEAELQRINRLYDAELQRLRKLWAGAPAGSLGPIAGPPATAPAPTPVSNTSR